MASVHFLCIWSLILHKLVDGEKFTNFPKINQTDFEQFESEHYPSIDKPDEIYDFIIVGAGAAGCVLANRLSENSNWKILLLEAGGYENLTMDVPGLAYFYIDDKVNWQYETEPLPSSKKRETFSVARGKATGGSTVINGMIYTPGSSKIFDQWGERNPGWSYLNVSKYFRKQEHCIEDNIICVNMGINGPMNIETPPFYSNISYAIIDSLNQYPFEEVNTADPNYPDGYSRVPGMTANGYRFSSYRAYLVPIKNYRQNLHLMIDSHVTKVLIKKYYNGKLKAVGVKFKYRNQTFRVYASKEVILAAGAFNSPQILMLSGIGIREHLLEIGIKPIKNLPVGNNLMNHHILSLSIRSNKEILKSSEYDRYESEKNGPWTIPDMVEIIGFFHSTNSSPTIEYNFESSGHNLTDENRKYIFAFDIMLLSTKSRGYVRLRNNNPRSKPRIIFSPLTHESEEEDILQATKQLLDILEQPALEEWGIELMYEAKPHCDNFTLGSDAFWRCRIERDIGLLDHYSGTCKMGPKSDKMAVVDSELNVHGVNNLRVIDGSIMPIVAEGHTTSATLMIAEKGSDIIKKAWSR